MSNSLPKFSLSNAVRKNFNHSCLAILRHGGVGVIPTDTLYGVVGSALNPKTVLRIYQVRKRSLRKPMIVLIGDMKDLRRFGVTLNPDNYSLLNDYWPGKVSIVLPVGHRPSAIRFKYLHRGTKSIAFRLPADRTLRALLKKTGPLVAPSANPEGRPSAKTIAEAKKYFHARVDFYIDKGKLGGKASKLISLVSGAPVTLRR